MTLDDIAVGDERTVSEVRQGDYGDGLVARLQALGVAPGKRISVLRRGWFNGPIVARVGQTEIAMRRGEADLVVVISGIAGAADAANSP